MTEEKQHTPHRISPTSLDVARKAGVSQAAVSYVLNGVRNAHVGQETRAKILQAAQELGYLAHPSARSLRRGQSDEICCIIKTPPSSFNYEIHLSILQRIFLHGYIPVFYVSPGAPTRQWRETLQRMFARHPLGLIISQFGSMADDITLARQMGIENIVVISTEPVLGTPTIIFPNALPGHLAAQHLLERGHYHLGIVQPSDPLLEDTFKQRLEGMRSVMNGTPGAIMDVLPLTLSLPSAYTLVDTYLTGAEHPTGIYTFNDEYAFPLLRALADRGMRVPQDIAIIGTDDLPSCKFMRPSLTTIRFDSGDAIGQRAVETLISLHKGQPLSEDFLRSLVPQLIPRESI